MRREDIRPDIMDSARTVGRIISKKSGVRVFRVILTDHKEIRPGAPYEIELGVEAKGVPSPSYFDSLRVYFGGETAYTSAFKVHGFTPQELLGCDGLPAYRAEFLRRVNEGITVYPRGLRLFLYYVGRALNLRRGV